MTSFGDAPSPRRRIVIGSRKSELALWQARAVHELLAKKHPELEFEIRTEHSLGDTVQHKHLAPLAAANPGLFTKELEEGLLVRTVPLVGERS